MNARTGLKLWGVCYSLILLAMSLAAVFGLHQLARHHEAAGAYQAWLFELTDDLADGFDQLDALVLQALAGDAALDPAALQENAARVERSMHVLRQRLTAADASRLLVRLHELWARCQGEIAVLSDDGIPEGTVARRQALRQYLQARRELRRERLLLTRTTPNPDTGASLDLGTDWQFWAALVAGITFVGLVVASLRHRHIDETLARPLQRLRVLIDRARAGESHLRLPVDRSSLLHELADSCNKLIEAMEGLVQGSRLMIRQGTQLASVLVESFQDPVMVANPAGEPLLCNAAMRGLIEGRSGSEVLDELAAQLQAGGGQLTIRGVAYRTLVTEVTSVSDFPGLFVRLAAAEPPEARPPRHAEPSSGRDGSRKG